VADFQLRNIPLLSRVGADRSDQLRTDIDAAVAGWADAAVLRVDGRGQVLIADGRVLLGDTAALGDAPPEEAVFLGRIEGDRHVWAIRADLPAPDEGVDAHVLDLRRAGTVFDDVSAQLVSSATALLNWHDNARFSAIDGSPTKSIKAGWSRVNTVTGHEEFPRIDPAVICLVHDGVGVNGSHVLLARQPTWPKDRYSVLAGFVEAGESLEDCVVREIGEEVGLAVRDVRYLGNQPWPFPRSLMVGFTAVADRSAPLLLADGEIAEARWISREQVRGALAGGTAEGFGLPGGVSIARHMVEAWAAVD
jgi:NAD+ diphosphatase